MKRILILLAAIICLNSLFAVADENPLQDARVGEWAVYATSNGSMQERHQVISRRKELVVIKIESIINGKTISSKIENFKVEEDNPVKGAAGPAPFRASGTRYNCYSISKGKRTLYYSNEVPVTGLVAIEKDGEVIKEIINFGN